MLAVFVITDSLSVRNRKTEKLLQNVRDTDHSVILAGDIFCQSTLSTNMENTRSGANQISYMSPIMRPQD